MQKHIIGLVLSGGKSSRMGRDKSQLKYNKKSWLKHMLDVLQDAGLQRCIVSGKPILQETFQEHHIQFIEDLIPNKGPLGGIYSCLKLMKSDLLVVPVDTPLVTSKQLNQLVNAGYEDSNEYASVSYQGHPIPCFIKYSENIVAKLEETLCDTNQSKSVGKFLKGIGLRELRLTSPIINFNTPKELNFLEVS